ncbi:CGG triplet repeat-binding protein 1-like [Sipha flava]|uniref:CGG triplet repeat-binding protein 1-like n=1 Tax=Sipha flava TaxID=143950 RepID=A0A8B8FA01_9HEMI|nr:CGG triplet repeat-binding protein 1-like [Sipha flava]
MPKDKLSLARRLRSYVQEFGSDTFSHDSSILFCKYCEIKVNCEKKFNVTQHLKTDKHTKAVKRKQEESVISQQKFLTHSSKKSCFNKDLCQALLSANIPLNKLSNNRFRSFLSTYTGKEIPMESTLRQGYVHVIYIETKEKIKS